MKNFLCLLVLLVTFYGQAQSAQVDSSAVYILDRMSSVIGELGSCSFTIDVSKDVLVNAYGPEKHFSTNEVKMVGPDKMAVQTYGNKGTKGYWYDGEQVAYYSYGENNYTIVEAPDNIIGMIEAVNEDYGVEFPAADFFYPSFTDDILEHYENVVFLGTKKIEGTNCFHIMATNDKINVQLWITDDALSLPKKFHITYKSEDKRQYEGTFSNWELNPEIPEAIFQFLPPPNAKQVSVMVKS